MKLWIGIVVVVVIIVLVLIIIGIAKSNKKKKVTQIENALTGETRQRLPDGTVVDPLMEQIKGDYDKSLTDNEARERLRKVRELYKM